MISKMLSVAVFSCVWLAAVAEQGHPHHHKSKRAVTSDKTAGAQSGELSDSGGFLDIAAKRFLGGELMKLGKNSPDAIGLLHVANHLFIPGPTQFAKKLVAQAAGGNQAPANATAGGEESEESGGSGLLDYIMYLVFASLFAVWYWAFEGKRNFVGNSRASEKKQLVGDPEHFDHGLFHCCDEPLLTALSCCCCAVRWADTMTIAGQFGFVVAYIIYVALYGLDYIGLPGSLILAIVCTFKRQRLRELAKIPHGDCGTVCADFWAYCCCAPCAIVQEARQFDEAYGGTPPEERGGLPPVQQETES